jgi:hypothetical protein
MNPIGGREGKERVAKHLVASQEGLSPMELVVIMMMKPEIKKDTFLKHVSAYKHIVNISHVTPSALRAGHQTPSTKIIGILY